MKILYRWYSWRIHTNFLVLTELENSQQPATIISSQRQSRAKGLMKICGPWAVSLSTNFMKNLERSCATHMRKHSRFHWNTSMWWDSQKTDMLDNVSQNSFDDRTEAKGFNLSEDWSGTTRLRILRTTLEGFEWVLGRPLFSTRLQDQTIFAWSWTQWSKKQGQNKLQHGQKWMPNCTGHAATSESTRLVWNWTGTKFLRCHAFQRGDSWGQLCALVSYRNQHRDTRDKL